MSENQPADPTGTDPTGTDPIRTPPGEDVPAAPPVARDELATRIDGLAAAAAAARGHVDPEVLAPAEQVTARVSERLKLSGEHTIVALAGATGSGKSSLFNALTDMELAGTGVRRPTTSWALACAWGPDGAEELLAWMGIPARHQVSRMSMLDRSAEDTRLDGLVLLDLPDHDSTEVSHHLEMERLVQYSDMLVWVLDPQKYADAAIHERYIRPMAPFSEVTVVVLNQIDRIPYEQREQALADVRRLVVDDGLADVRVIGVSATRGDGLDDLKRELAGRIRSKGAAKARLAADVGAAASSIAEVAGEAPVPVIGDDVRRRLTDELAECAGVDQFTSAVLTSTRRRVRQRTGWPVARWVGRLRSGRDDDRVLGDTFSSASLAVVPEIAPVPRAQVDLVVRELVDDVTSELARPWRTGIRAAVVDDVAVAVDEAIASAGVTVSRTPVWWRLVQGVQWLLLAAAVVGLVWWGAQTIAGRSNGSFDLPDVGEVAGIGVAPLVGVGALVLGIALGLVSRLLALLSGRRKARKADLALRASLRAVADDTILRPVEGALAEYAAYHAGLCAALA